MLIRKLTANRVYIICGRTDMRLGIDGLSAIVSGTYEMNPFESAMFLFCGRKHDRMKALLWDGDGFLLLYKRLEASSFKWPQSKEEIRELTSQQLRWLLEGLSIDQPGAVRVVHPKIAC